MGTSISSLVEQVSKMVFFGACYARATQVAVVIHVEPASFGNQTGRSRPVRAPLGDQADAPAINAKGLNRLVSFNSSGSDSSKEGRRQSSDEGIEFMSELR